MALMGEDPQPESGKQVHAQESGDAGFAADMKHVFSDVSQKTITEFGQPESHERSSVIPVFGGASELIRRAVLVQMAYEPEQFVSAGEEEADLKKRKESSPFPGEKDGGPEELDLACSPEEKAQKLFQKENSLLSRRKRNSGVRHSTRRWKLIETFCILAVTVGVCEASAGTCFTCMDRTLCPNLMAIYGENDELLYETLSENEIPKCAGDPPITQKCYVCWSQLHVNIYCHNSIDSFQANSNGSKITNITKGCDQQVKPTPNGQADKAKSALGVSVICPTKKYVVMLFQPVTLTCDYTTTATQMSQSIVTWKYKSYCKDPIQMALNPSSADNIIAQNNPNYNPSIECADSQRTVRSVVSKQGDAVTLGNYYQGRKISILNKADLNIAEAHWGESGVYYCSVTSAQDLQGNNEDYIELIVLDSLLVLLVVLGFFLLLALIGICWCQCCPHTCCCYVSCPCCPDRCCCPRALYEAGKAVKKAASSNYAMSMYAQPVYGGSQGNQSFVPLMPIPNGGGPPPGSYARDYDGASSVGQGSQVPLLQDNGPDNTRSGYRIQVDPDGNATRAIYYLEKELASLDPSRPANYSRLDNMSTVTSLHDGGDPRGRGGRVPLATVYDQDEAMSTISSVSQQGQRRDDYPRRGDGGGYMGDRFRARSMENLDDVGRRYRNEHPPHRGADEPRGRRGSDDEWSSSARSGYDRHYDDRRRRDYSPDDRRRRDEGPQGGLAGRRSHSRDDIMEMDRDRRPGDGSRGGREEYDDTFLREVMERKRLGEPQRARSQERLESDRSEWGKGPRGPPPLPVSLPSGNPGRRDNYPPSDNESVLSAQKTNLRKNGAVSRESLVV